MDTFTCAACFDIEEWVEDEFGEYGIPLLSCSIAASVHEAASTKTCTARFTVTAEDTHGATGSITFVNYYDYEDWDKDWWL